MSDPNLFTVTKLDDIQRNPVSLSLPEDITMQRWSEIGHQLLTASKVLNWWIGDWLAYGAKKFGAVKEFAVLNGFNYGTLRNIAWVCSSVDVSRRLDALDFWVHAEVAALPAREQKEWLQVAVEKSWPAAMLRKEIRKSKSTESALEGDGPRLLSPTKLADDLSAWLCLQPDEFWDQERRALWCERLRPIADLYVRIRR